MGARPNLFMRGKLSSLRQARRKRTRQFIIEQLEDRRVLAVASPPDQPLNLVSISTLLASGHFNAGALFGDSLRDESHHQMNFTVFRSDVPFLTLRQHTSFPSQPRWLRRRLR